MPLWQVRIPVDKQLLPQAAGVISRFIGAPALQFRDHQVDKIDVAFRGDDAGQVEPVQARFCNPGFQLIGTCSGDPTKVM